MIIITDIINELFIALRLFIILFDIIIAILATFFWYGDYRWLFLYQAALKVKLSLYPITFLSSAQHLCFIFGRSQLEISSASQIDLRQIHLHLKHVSNEVLTNPLQIKSSGPILRFYIMLWLNAPTFRQNVLTPSSGWLACFTDRCVES